MSTLKIEELNVDDDIKQGLRSVSITEVTPTQQEVITNLLAGRGLIVETDPEDKTGTMVVCVLGVSFNRSEEKGTKCVVLSSSPRNVQAIDKQIAGFNPANLTCAAMDSYTEAHQNKAVLDKEPDILITTPCILQKTMQKMRHIFRHVRYIVLDGLDEMNTSEQRSCLKQIRLRTVSDYTGLIFASDLKQVKKESSRYVEDPVVIGFNDSVHGSKQTPPDLSPSLRQGFINVPPRMKISTLMAYIQQESKEKTVIFAASKRGTDRLYKIFKKQDLQVSSLHNRLSEGKKAQRLEKFTGRRASYLLVSEITAVELELNNIDQVINYDVPDSADEYRFRAALLHSNKAGNIISLVSGQDRSDIQELQNELDIKLTKLDLPANVKRKVENKKKQTREKRQKKKREMELPRSNYDKLSGGRNGNQDEEKSGIVQLFKKLFNS